ncbi:MAG: hypothetical protein EB084_19020 [Proteobacteria bacterium]|nr:hypothetical protein [Pseudomonadota bacterium]
MRASFIIARLTLIETLRRQIELITFFIAIGIAVLPTLTNAFGLGASDRVVKDIALTFMGYYGLLLALFFGSVAIPGEIERKLIYPVITRPMPRRAYLWGKWLGIMGFIVFSQLVLGITLWGSMAFLMKHYDLQIWKVVLGYLLEEAVVLAMCMAFSTFASPPLAAVLGLFVYIIGGLPQAFIDFFLTRNAFQRMVSLSMKALLPHFEVFHVKNAVVHHDFVTSAYMAAIVGYGVIWVIFAQLLGETAFERRNL